MQCCDGGCRGALFTFEEVILLLPGKFDVVDVLYFQR